ncbi:MAG: hypothetical protein E7191_07770 [Erysipelotrichaceae bacterium]|nr:hypothetical protein [Erysipelotrichaceae bacterium]
MKTLVAIMMLLSITLGSAFTTDVHAAGGPNLTVKHTVNGSLVTLAEGATATSEVTIVSDVPAVFYLNGTSVSDGYSTQKKVGGTGSFTVYAVDQAGNMSDTVSFKVDAAPAIISSYELAKGIVGATEVNIKTGQKPVYYVINGVKQSTLTPTGTALTLTQTGSYTVYAIDEVGRKSNELVFSIPTVGQVTTTTTTKKPPVTTPKQTTPKQTTPTSPVSGTVELTMNIADGATVTNKDVTLEAKEAVYFIVNGVKESKTAKALTISEEGVYTVSAVNAKNVKSEELTFTIDRTLPVLTLEVAGLAVEPGILEEAVTVKSSEAGVFYINDVAADTVEKSEMVIDQSGTYTVKVVDAAKNEATVSFVLNMPEVKPGKDNEGGMSWLLYVLIGMVAGGAVVGGVFFFMNKKKEEEIEYIEVEEETTEDSEKK